jgi:uncharacterized membrane protein
MFKYSFLLSAILLVVIDSIYLNFIKGYFSNQVQKIQKSPIKVNLLATFICYIFLITGLNYFIISQKKSPRDAFLLGLVIYGVYETTNWALFKNWYLLTVLMDTLWGAILFGLVTLIVKKSKIK